MASQLAHDRCTLKPGARDRRLGGRERRRPSPLRGTRLGLVLCRTPQNAFLKELLKQLLHTRPRISLDPGGRGPGNKARLLGQRFAKYYKRWLVEYDFLLVLVQMEDSDAGLIRRILGDHALMLGEDQFIASLEDGRRRLHSLHGTARSVQPIRCVARFHACKLRFVHDSLPLALPNRVAFSKWRSSLRHWQGVTKAGTMCRRQAHGRHLIAEAGHDAQRYGADQVLVFGK